EPVRDLAGTIPRPVGDPGAKPLEDPITDPFRHAVDGVKKEGFTIVSEELPPVTADGRIVGAGGRLDDSFARAAATLAERGDVTQPITSPYGVHIILLLEVLPSQIIPPDERRRLVREEVLVDRAHASERALLERLKGNADIDRNADALLATVAVEGPGAAPSV